MPKIMVKILHIKAAKSAERFVEYITNRSGVDKSLSSQVVVLKATERQKEYINELLKLCPDAKDSYEYEDYIENPTRQNASAFISIVAEYNPQLFADRETYMPVSAVYAPSAEADSKAYQNFKRKAADQNTEIMHPENYESFPFGSARVEILACPDNADNLNNTSIILKVTHKNKSFLFTGDAEREEEQTLLDRGLLKSDVLKVGHHGSDTSTSYPFLREVMPEYAVISVGKDNFIRTPYGSRFEPFKGRRCAGVQNRPARRYNYDKRRR